MNTHEKQRFVTDELTALLRRIDPDIRGAVYTESNTAAHVVITTTREKPLIVVDVTGCGLIGMAHRALDQIDIFEEDKP